MSAVIRELNRYDLNPARAVLASRSDHWLNRLPHALPLSTTEFFLAHDDIATGWEMCPGSTWLLWIVGQMDLVNDSAALRAIATEVASAAGTEVALDFGAGEWWVAYSTCVEALASAFGMSTADFLGESVPVPAVFKVTIETHLIGDPKRAEDLYVAIRDRLFAPDVAGEVLREAGVKAHLPGFGSITVKCDRRSARL